MNIVGKEKKPQKTDENQTRPHSACGESSNATLRKKKENVGGF